MTLLRLLRRRRAARSRRSRGLPVVAVLLVEVGQRPSRGSVRRRLVMVALLPRDLLLAWDPGLDPEGPRRYYRRPPVPVEPR